METLHPRLTLTEARARRVEALASLSRDEFRLVECAFTSNAHVFGDMTGGTVLLSKVVKAVPPKRKTTKREETMGHGGHLVRKLVKHGWLRFAPGASQTNGYFWPTSEAETLWTALQERKTAESFEARRRAEGL